MFTTPELQVVLKTLTHRRDWLVKSLTTASPNETEHHHQQTLQLLESALRKLKSFEEPSQYAGKETVLTSKNSYHHKIMPEKIKVLIVDDDTMITTLLSTYLMALGIQKISVAEDGQRAITMLYDAKPVYDLVLCDWNMPIKNGLDVHNAMRATERYQNTCFMLVTANSEAKQIRSAIEEGVDDYVVKPIDQSILNKKIARLFSQIVLPESE